MCLIAFLAAVLMLFVFYMLSDSWLSSYYECKKAEQQIYLEWLKTQQPTKKD